MPTEIINLDDLREFKVELFLELKRILQENHGRPAKKWFRFHEISKILYIKIAMNSCQ
jgi:hypothetical protein